MWEKLGLKSEPFLSIEPLSTKEEINYFVNREREIFELRSYLSDTNPLNLLITGKAGVGKTTLVNKVTIDLPTSIRVDLSHLEEFQTTIDRITLEVAKYAKSVGIRRGSQIEEQLIYASRIATTMSKKFTAKIPMFSTQISKEEKEEQSLKEALISRESMLDELEAISKKRGTPIVFLDDADHLSEELQQNILDACEPMFSSKRCISIFATRKETGNLFAANSNSRYRARFTDFVELSNVIEVIPDSVHKILLPRFSKLVLDNFVYPFSTETEKFLGDISDGNIRELLRYASIILRQALVLDVNLPIGVDFAMGALSSKNYLVSNVDEKIFSILSSLRESPKSASDETFQKDIGVGRAALSNLCNRLIEINFLQKIIEKNRILYGLGEKGKYALIMYEKFRK